MVSSELFEAICARDEERALALCAEPGVVLDVRTGVSPLQAAASRGLVRVAAALLDRGAMLEYASGKTGWIPGGTALHHAIKDYRWLNHPWEQPIESAETVRVLLDHGADPDARLKGRLTPRSLAEDPKAWIRGRRRENSAFHHPADPELRAAIRALFPPSR